MIRRAAAIALVLLGCGGSPADEPTVTISRLDFIVRMDTSGRWYVQSDADHMPAGGNPSVTETPDALILNFGRAFTHAGAIQITSDDDYGKAGIHAHCNLGLTGSRCILMHRFEAITPAQAFQIAPPGSGNFWVSVTMTDRR